MLPIGVPGPTRQISSLSDWFSMSDLLYGYGVGRDQLARTLRLDEVEYAHTVDFRRAAPCPPGIAQRLHDVGIAGGPVLAHREPRELVVLRVVFILLRAIDELHDVETHAVRMKTRPDLLRVWIVAPLRRQLGEQAQHGCRRAATLDIHIGVKACAARVADVLLPLRHPRHRLRQLAACRKEVDLEYRPAALARLLEHIVEWCVGGKAAVPVVLAIDLDRRQSGRQRGARHDVAHIEPLL